VVCSLAKAVVLGAALILFALYLLRRELGWLILLGLITYFTHH
jgi:hypothetical protein